MQYRIFVYRILNFEIYSLVINIANLVNKAVLLEKIIPAPGLINPIVELPIADPDQIKNSVIISNIFFYLNSYIFSFKIHYLF